VPNCESVRIGIGNKLPQSELHISSLHPEIKMEDTDGDDFNIKINENISNFIAFGSMSLFIDADDNNASSSFSLFQGTGTNDDDKKIFSLSKNGNMQISGNIFSNNQLVNFYNEDADEYMVLKCRRIWTQEEILVEANYPDGEPGWPDYVFGEGYKLMSLNELKSYIAKNKHLPNVPNATEISENGIPLAEMNRVLLEKVEELTLYIIKMNEQIEMMQTIFNNQK
jgi:hypothetical protein